MEIVDGYLQLEQLQLLVPYLLIVRQLQDRLLKYAKLGDKPVFQMEQHASPNLPVPLIQLKLLVETQEQMVYAFG